MYFTAEFTLQGSVGARMPVWHCVVTDSRSNKRYGAVDSELDTALLKAVDTMDLDRINR